MLHKKFATIAMLCVIVFLLLNQFALAQDWPQWRGQNRDGVLTDYSVPQSRPESLTPKWSVEIGTGHSSPVVSMVFLKNLTDISDILIKGNIQTIQR